MNPWRYARRFATKAVLAGSLVVGGGLAGVGCTGTGRGAIPADAQELGSGTGQVSTTALKTGKVWVLDQTDNALVWSGQARRGDRIVVDPRAEKVIVGGENVADRNLSSDHKYRIYHVP